MSGFDVMCDFNDLVAEFYDNLEQDDIVEALHEIAESERMREHIVSRSLLSGPKDFEKVGESIWAEIKSHLKEKAEQYARDKIFDGEKVA